MGQAADQSSSKRQSRASLGNYDLTASVRTSPEKGKYQPQDDNLFSIDGQEKHIRKLLEKKRQEMFPTPVSELGSRVQAVKMNTRPHRDGHWIPKGTLVAHFAEHSGLISDIKMSPDHAFFATGSHDGTVKIWDTRRLHTNVANRARLTFSGNSTCY